jgi:hypothetical protein
MTSTLPGGPGFSRRAQLIAAGCRLSRQETPVARARPDQRSIVCTGTITERVPKVDGAATRAAAVSPLQGSGGLGADAAQNAPADIAASAVCTMTRTP